MSKAPAASLAPAANALILALAAKHVRVMRGLAPQGGTITLSVTIRNGAPQAEAYVKAAYTDWHVLPLTMPRGGLRHDLTLLGHWMIAHGAQDTDGSRLIGEGLERALEERDPQSAPVTWPLPPRAGYVALEVPTSSTLRAAWLAGLARADQDALRAALAEARRARRKR